MPGDPSDSLILPPAHTYRRLSGRTTTEKTETKRIKTGAVAIPRVLTSRGANSSLNAFSPQLAFEPVVSRFFKSPEYALKDLIESNDAAATDVTRNHLGENDLYHVNPQSGSGFFKLPAEMRNTIYCHLLVRHAPLEATTIQVDRHYDLSPAVLSVCRRTKGEAITLLYGSNQFCVSHPSRTDVERDVPAQNLDLVVAKLQQPLLRDLCITINGWPRRVSVNQINTSGLKDHMYMLTRLLKTAGPSLRRLKLVFYGTPCDNFDGYVRMPLARYSPFREALERYVSEATVIIRLVYPFGFQEIEILTGELSGRLQLLRSGMDLFYRSTEHTNLVKQRDPNLNLAPFVAAARAKLEARLKEDDEALRSIFDGYTE